VVLGAFIAASALSMEMIEESLIHFKDHWAQDQIMKNNFVASWLVYALFSGLLAVLAATLTTYWGPGAAGSGVAEVIGYVNGVNYPETISVRSLFTKIFGVVLAIAGSLCIGKEGPLAHIGANWGAAVIYMGGEHSKFLQNDQKKRYFIAAGSSAGVSLAFGAPIGGALFIFELSKNPFWKFSLLWKTFLASSSAVFFLALFESIVHSKTAHWTSSVLKFGEIRTSDVTPTDIIPGAIIIGAICGLLGAFFISVNTKINVYRAKYITAKWQKLIDAFVFAFATATCFYWASNLFQSCVPRLVLLPDGKQVEVAF